MRIPKLIYSPKSSVMFVVCLTLFVLFFAITYTPNYGLGEDATSLGDLGEGNAAIALWYQHKGLCLPICCAIVLCTTALSRAMLLFFTRTARLREMEYLMWQLAEVVVAALFCNLFLSLYLHLGYFENLPLVLLVYISVAIYPYAFYWLLAERLDRDLRIAEAQRTILRLRQHHDEDDNGTLRLADDKGTVKLVVGAEHVISIESAGNYVTVLYMQGERLMRYSLRNTMKGIEDACSQHSLIRCHRSYYLNLSRVRLLRRTTDGLVAEVDIDGVPNIPVSKSYANEVTQRFAERK